MIRLDDAKSAAREFLAASLTGQGWQRALDHLASAAGAGGATLMRFQDGRPLASVSSSGWADIDAQLVAGVLPCRLPFFPDHAYGRGFCADQDVFTEEEMLRDPYFQEVLRPRGVFYHARARLWSDAGERMSLSLKRLSNLGHYQPDDIAVLDSVLSEMRAAVRIARRALDAEAKGAAGVLHRLGEPVFEFDAFGRVLRVHGNDSERFGLLVRNRRLVAAERLEQPLVERAVAAAVALPKKPALASVTGRNGDRCFLQLVPVAGGFRDLFPVAAAVAVVIEPSRRPAGTSALAPALRDALGLTAREAQIAALLAQGLSLKETAERLRMEVGTARNHLKSVFDKSGVRRQGELIALLSRLCL